MAMLRYAGFLLLFGLSGLGYARQPRINLSGNLGGRYRQIEAGSGSIDLSNLTLVRSVNLENGLLVKILTGGHPAGTESITISKGGRQLAGLKTRPLIDSWLTDDAFWGGHENANETRYLDYGDSTGGVISSVVAAPGGCLIDMGMAQLEELSMRYVSTDFILRWRADAPNKWEVFDRSPGGEQPGLGEKVIRYRKELFLVSGTTVFKLDGPLLKRRPIATLPNSPEPQFGWNGAATVGSKLLLEFEDWPDGHPPHLQLDLSSHRLSKVTESDLRKFGVTSLALIFGSEWATALGHMPDNIGYQDAVAISNSATGYLRQTAQLTVQNWGRYNNSHFRSVNGFGPSTDENY